MSDQHKAGYKQALDDFEELLDNAAQNHSGPKALQHWDFELRDQLAILRDEKGISEQ